MITIEQMVQREVNCCLSHLVSAMAEGDQFMPVRKRDYPIAEMCAQALELASPIPDYEEAARQNGLVQDAMSGCWSDKDGDAYADAQEACDAHQIESDVYDREVYEFWAVSQWLADKLIAQGEKVDTDFAGMCVWARTCSGQGIASDGVIERIYSDMIKA